MGRTICAIGVFLLVLACVMLGGCGGADNGLSPDHGVSGFELTVIPGTLVDGASAESFDLNVDESGPQVAVTVDVTEAMGLKALYLTIGYDEAAYTPESVEVSDALGDEAALLSLDILDRPGEVHIGRVLTRFEDRPGFSGSATLATVRFSREARTSWRQTSSVPTSDLSRVPLGWNDENTGLEWRYWSQGDYNMDKLVNVSDMTPIGQRWGNSSGGGQFDPNSADSACDGNNNGLIEVGDITPIGQNYGNMVSGYNIYQGLLADVPTDASDDNGEATLVTSITFEDRTVIAGERPEFSHILESPVGAASYWVRPHDSVGTEGVPSNSPNYPNIHPTTLLVTNPPDTGEGTDALPYIVDNDDTYNLSAMNSGVGDVTLHEDTEYFISDEEAGSIDAGTAVLTVDSDFEGAFTVHATYEDIATNRLHFSVGIPPVLTFVNMPLTGMGLEADPFIVDVDTTYIFTLYHLLDGEVCGDENTVWNVSEAGAGTVSKGPSQATLNIEDGFTGTFLINPTYQGVPSLPTGFYLRVPEADATALTLVNTPAIGDGTELDPYRADTTTDYQFSLVHGVNGEVSTDANTVFNVSDPLAGSIGAGTNIINVEDTFNGEFSVTATYNGVASVPPVLYFDVPVVNPTDPPVAAISADPQTSDVTPVEVTLDASASTDSDGTIEFYSWDFDGDGEYDVTDNTDPTYDNTYAGTGEFNATVMVTDNDGATDTATVLVTITDEGNYWPTCVLTADSTGGEIPQTVNFDASGSSDPETASLHYMWDLDGDGTFETDGGNTATIQHEYTGAGHFWVAVKVFDEADAWDYDEWELTLTSGGNLPPTAQVTADPVYINPPPGTVNFNAGDSLDEDGTIVGYRWDFDGDGTYDEGPNPGATTSHEYTSTGNFTARVEVEDDDGDTDTATIHITVTDNPASWHLYEVYTPDGTEVLSAGRFSSLKQVDGLPAIAFQAVYDGAEYTKKKAMYVRATDATGTTWGTPVVLDDPQWEQEASGVEIDLEIVDGNPAVCFARHEWVSSGWRYGLYFKRAADTLGADWSAATADVDSPSDGSRGTHCDLAVAGGNPAISYFDTRDQTLYYTGASAADGSAWNTPVLLDDNSTVTSAYSSGEYGSMCIVDGNPAVAYLTRVSDISAGYHLRYVRATDAAGSTWAAAQSLDTEQNLAQGISMCLLPSGYPAVAYSGADDDNNYLYFIGAGNAAGSAWNARNTAVSVSGWSNMVTTPSMMVFDGVPVCGFMRSGFMDGSLKFTRATAADGSAWQAPENITDPGDVLEVSCCVINGMPAISYESEGAGALYFAIYY